MSYNLNLNHDMVGLHTKAVVSLRFSLSGNVLASCSADKKVGLYNTETASQISSLEGEHTYGINDCVWLTDNLIATGSDDQTVRVWDVEMGKVLSTFKGTRSFVYSLALNPVNRAIISGGYDGSVTMFHLSCKDPLMRFSGHSEPIVSIATDSQGAHYATGAQDGLVRIWSPAGPAMCVRTVICTENQAFPLSSVSYSPNSQYMLVSSLDSTHRLHRLDLSEKANSNVPVLPVRSYTGHVNSKYSVFSALYSVGSGAQQHNFVVSGSEASRVCMWDLESAAETATKGSASHQGPVLAVACNPNPDCQNQIASAGVDCSVKLWGVAEVNIAEEDTRME